MKKLVFMVGFLGLFLYSGTLVEAADIQAQLDSLDGTSAFAVQDSSTADVAKIDSKGAISMLESTEVLIGLNSKPATSQPILLIPCRQTMAMPANFCRATAVAL